jgi:hypothetical protein
MIDGGRDSPDLVHPRARSVFDLTLMRVTKSEWFICQQHGRQSCARGTLAAESETNDFANLSGLTITI